MRLIIIVFLLVLGWTAWPYYAVYDLASAVRDADVAGLEHRVEWNSVRDGLRGDLNAALLQKVGQEAESNESSGNKFGEGLAVMLGPVFIEKMVNSYVTPQAIAAARRASLERIDANTGKKSRTINDNVEAFTDLDFSRIEHAFFTGGPFTFRLDYQPEDDAKLNKPVGLIFEWNGDWRLSRVILPEGAFDSIPNTLEHEDEKEFFPVRKGDKLGANEVGNQSEETSLPEPIEVVLIQKNFVSRDIHAQRYNDYIHIILDFNNKTGRDIRAFDGVATFEDLLGNKILASKIAVNDPIKAGNMLSWEGSIDYNQFMDEHKNLRAAKQDNIHVIFHARKILFSDGNTKQY